MSDFVDECQKEWRRLKVPKAIANEMAADLRADLAEADAEGVTAEYVLGNGVFDPRSFAAAWAAARGLVSARPSEPHSWSRRLVPIGVAVASALALLVGFALLARGHAVEAMEVVPRGVKPVPASVVPPLRGVGTASGEHALGLVVLAIGFAGVLATLLLWRAWARRSSSRHDAELPGYYLS